VDGFASTRSKKLDKKRRDRKEILRTGKPGAERKTNLEEKCLRPIVWGKVCRTPGNEREKT